jgi:hypothetical protein
MAQGYISLKESKFSRKKWIKEAKNIKRREARLKENHPGRLEPPSLDLPEWRYSMFSTTPRERTEKKIIYGIIR